MDNKLMKIFAWFLNAQSLFLRVPKRGAVVTFSWSKVGQTNKNYFFTKTGKCVVPKKVKKKAKWNFSLL